MPLIHSKKPKAFQQNIRTEIHAGKPQKQAVAVAYSIKRDAEKKKHKYASGGCVGEGCPGPHYDDGGDVQEPSTWDKIKKAFSEPEAQAAPKPTGSNAGSDSGAAKLGQGWSQAGFSKGGSVEDHLDSKEKMLMKAHFSDGGEVKGVHKELPAGFESNRGKSEAGTYAVAGSNARYEPLKKEARELHSKKLEELKSMPNPKLKGLAEGGEVEGDMDIKPEEDQDYDSEIHDMLGKELMDAFHSKDHKRMCDGLEALVHKCLSEKEDE